MKKTYIGPLMTVVRTASATVICTSPGVTSDKGIGYGGVDEEGEKDPASRRRHDQWDDDEEGVY